MKVCVEHVRYLVGARGGGVRTQNSYVLARAFLTPCEERRILDATLPTWLPMALCLSPNIFSCESTAPSGTIDTRFWPFCMNSCTSGRATFWKA